MARLKNGADLDGERLPAYIAFVSSYAGALALHLTYPFSSATMGTNRAIRPKSSLNIGVCSFFVLKVGFGDY